MYSESFKAKMVQRLSAPNGPSQNALAAEVGVPQATLSRWVRQAGRVGPMARKKKKSPRSGKKAEKKRPADWSTEEKLRVVLEAASLPDEEVGAFLRREGIHEAQLDAWRQAVAEALESKPKRKGKKKSPEAKRVRELEKELRRKEKALAEAGALLVLQKKLRALWEDEDDDTDPGSGK